MFPPFHCFDGGGMSDKSSRVVSQTPLKHMVLLTFSQDRKTKLRLKLDISTRAQASSCMSMSADTHTCTRVLERHTCGK